MMSVYVLVSDDGIDIYADGWTACWDAADDASAVVTETEVIRGDVDE